jgi:EpsI family protein
VISSNARFAVVALLLTGTGLFLHTRRPKFVAYEKTSAVSLPLQFADWVGADIPIAPDILKELGRAEILQRAYHHQMLDEPDVYLYLAYYPNQQAGDRRHTPDDCLPGSGWSIADSGTTTLSLPEHRPFPANRYVITKRADRQLVLFWFWARGRGVASEDWADFYLVLDTLHLKRSDDALIRINTPLQTGEEPDAAQRRLFSFAAELTPLMDSYMPR